MLVKIGNCITVTFLLFGLIHTSCQNQPAERPEVSPTVVRTAPVGVDTLSFPIHTSGILVSPVEMRLSFKVGGIIERILGEEGRRVKKNQLLAVLQQSEIQATAQRARSAYEKSVRDFQRVTALYEDSVATLEQKQDAETALTVARSNLEIAEYNSRYSTIVAPTNGKILKRLAEINELIDPGRPVFLFGSTEGSWLVRAGIADRDIVKLQHGDSAEVRFDAYPGETFRAIISKLAQSADPYTGTYEVELTLLPHTRQLIFGFVAELKIYPARKERYYLVPIEALVEASGSKGFIFYLETPAQIARKASIHIQGVYQNRLVVQEGLEGIETLITEGSPYLSDGSPVQVKNP